ncbi:CIR N-terminal domain-containing protein [Nocardia macrotermitis]|uniref:Bacterial CdiA-CT RNAse A domain-containing protein n=1 Tax=Nocardia macrotermitis TaxID=2585198 RepID=A0A7K0D431_9NOCA|nr:CIR N-terminal domain-containing protein [Nocardia macrotermitis]MQY20447.1 hypothetical protein [Nocardia macrotermitis]
MTTIDVQPSIYYTAATALHGLAVDLYNAFDGRGDALDQCGSMAGSYDEAKSWAAGYDANSHQALQTMFSLAELMDTYAKALRTLGYNHQLADWNATTGTKGAAPTRPADPLPAVLMCRKSPPSAGGPGNGLSDAIHLAEKVGIIIPDGDLDKLSALAGTWTTMHADHAINGLAASIGRIIDSVSLVKSPEATHVVEDLQGMKLSANTIVDGCDELAKSCQSHHDDLHNLRERLKKKLEELAKSLAVEVGVTIILGAVANCLTAGLATVVTAARVAKIVDRFVGPIREMVEAWVKARKAKKAFQAEQKLAAEQKKIAEIQQRVQQNAQDWLSGGGKYMSREEEQALLRGPGRDLVRALRKGDKLTAEQQQKLDLINSAMSKAPVHAGPVRRDIDLTGDELASLQKSFQEGKPWNGNGFMNSSTNPAGVNNGGMVNTTNTTFQIVSKTGRDVSELGGTHDEVAFQSATKFLVKGIKADPSNPRRTIIQLVEP